MPKGNNKLYEAFIKNDGLIQNELSEIVDEEVRNDMLLFYLSNLKEETASSEEIIKDLAVRLTKFVFRNGPVERLHSGKYLIENYDKIPPNTPLEQISQLTEADMKLLNKFMVDRIGYLLSLFANGEYTKLKHLLSSPFHSANSWDDPGIEKVEKEFFR